MPGGPAPAPVSASCRDTMPATQMVTTSTRWPPIQEVIQPPRPLDPWRCTAGAEAAAARALRSTLALASPSAVVVTGLLGGTGWLAQDTVSLLTDLQSSNASKRGEGLLDRAPGPWAWPQPPASCPPGPAVSGLPRGS